MSHGYKKQGLDFGLSHKAAYWQILLFAGSFPFLLNRVSDFVSGVLTTTSMPTILVYLIGLLIGFIGTIFSFILKIPMEGYGMELISNPDEGLKERLSRCLGRLKPTNLIALLTTNLYIWFPFGSCYLAIWLIKTAGIRPGILGALLLLGSLFALYESYKRLILYMLVPYILALDPDATGSYARSESADMMTGHLAEATLLGLEFLGLSIVSMVLVIPLIWFVPYMYATKTYYALTRLTAGGFVSFEETEDEEYEEESVEEVEETE